MSQVYKQAEEQKAKEQNRRFSKMNKIANSKIYSNNYLVVSNNDNDITSIIDYILKKHNYTNIVAFVNNDHKELIEALTSVQGDIIYASLFVNYEEDFYKTHKDSIMIYDYNALYDIEQFISQCFMNEDHVSITFSDHVKYLYYDQIYSMNIIDYVVHHHDERNLIRFDSKKIINEDSIKCFIDICNDPTMIPSKLNHWLIDQIVDDSAIYLYKYIGKIDQNAFDEAINQTKLEIKKRYKLYLIYNNDEEEEEEEYEQYHHENGITEFIELDEEYEQDYNEHKAADVVTDYMYDYDQMNADYNQMILDHV